jgi:hypothetical protein
MTIKDIETYIIRYNLNTSSRKAEVIDQRMYLYAYLFHIIELPLEKIGAMFSYVNNKGKLVPRGHITVRHALLKADYQQHDDRFIKNTKLLNQQLRFVIPPYDVDRVPTKNKFEVCLTLSKDRFIEFIKSQNDLVIYDYLWTIMTQNAAKEHDNSVKKAIKYKKKS